MIIEERPLLNRSIRLAAILAISVLPTAPVARAADLPDYLQTLSGTTPPAPADLATQNVLQLNTSMFGLYQNAGAVFRRNILARHPIVLALFSGSGGRMILYRPGQAPLEAPSVPRVYQVLKSLGHSTLAISEVVMPYIGNPADRSWMGPMRAYLAEHRTALESFELADLPPEWRAASRTTLENNIAFMEDCLAKGAITMEATDAFARKQAPLLKLGVAWAAETQVKHWMGVLDGWKKLLGPDFDKAYGASNTIYVARQNNVLFSVLAQYFGPDAINDRLLLIETMGFTTTPEEMLSSLVRIVSDRAVGSLFFKSNTMMAYELMGGDARKTIVSEMKARGQDAFLPPLVPFGSKQWPALISGGSGPASLDDL